MSSCQNNPMEAAPKAAQAVVLGLPDVPAQVAARWYAIRTSPRHEKKVAAELEYRGVVNYLPLVCEVHRWSDRRKEVNQPLFPGYLFVHSTLTPEARVEVLGARGVLHFVGSRNWGTPVPDKQIDDIRTLVEHGVAAKPRPYVEVGQRVAICGGALEGVEGVLIGRNGRRRFVISIASIQQSLTISVEGYEIRPL